MTQSLNVELKVSHLIGSATRTLRARQVGKEIIKVENVTDNNFAAGAHRDFIVTRIFEISVNSDVEIDVTRDGDTTTLQVNGLFVITLASDADGLTVRLRNPSDTQPIQYSCIYS